MFAVLFYELQVMALIHDIVLGFFFGAFCLLCAIVVSTPVVWVFSKFCYWVTERRNRHGKGRFFKEYHY